MCTARPPAVHVECRSWLVCVALFQTLAVAAAVVHGTRPVVLLTPPPPSPTRERGAVHMCGYRSRPWPHLHLLIGLCLNGIRPIVEIVCSCSLCLVLPYRFIRCDNVHGSWLHMHKPCMYMYMGYCCSPAVAHLYGNPALATPSLNCNLQFQDVVTRSASRGIQPNTL